MSNSKLERVCLLGDPSTQIERFSDRQRRSVARAMGELVADVPAGLYVVSTSAGGEAHERMISVEPGRGYEDRGLRSTVPSAAPVLGTQASHEFHAEPASRLSRQPGRHFGAGGRLVVFVRRLAVGASAGDPRMSEPLPLDRLSVRTGDSGAELFDLATHAVIDPAQGWAAVSADVAPGPYVLRWREPRDLSKNSIWRNQERVVDQALWVPDGWILMCFIGQASGQGFERTATSFHLARLEIGWSAFGPEEERVNLAMEVALNGLRTGQNLVDAAQLGALLNAKFANPMFGIVGAHVLLQRGATANSVYEAILGNLKDLVGAEHPDLVGLRARRGETSLPSVEFPAMTYAGYRALVLRDPDEPDLLPDESFAERVAPRLRPEAPWTTWSPMDERLTDEHEAAAVTRAHHLMGSHDSGQVDAPLVAQHVISGPHKKNLMSATSESLHAFSVPTFDASTRTLIQAVPADQVGRTGSAHELARPEVQQLVRTLAAARDADDPSNLATLDESTLARMTGLPVGSVRRALRCLQEEGLLPTAVA